MNTIEILESNYPINNGNYNAFQCKLPLDFFTVIPVDDPVTSFVEIMKGIDTSKQYIDGTKIEANAKKNSFVWKKQYWDISKNRF